MARTKSAEVLLHVQGTLPGKLQSLSLALPAAQCGCSALLDEGNTAVEQGRLSCGECLEKAETSLHIKALKFQMALRYRQTTTTFAD